MTFTDAQIEDIGRATNSAIQLAHTHLQNAHVYMFHDTGDIFASIEDIPQPGPIGRILTIYIKVPDYTRWDKMFTRLNNWLNGEKKSIHVCR